jgi:hypothetical protein
MPDWQAGRQAGCEESSGIRIRIYCVRVDGVVTCERTLIGRRHRSGMSALPKYKRTSQPIGAWALRRVFCHGGSGGSSGSSSGGDEMTCCLCRWGLPPDFSFCTAPRQVTIVCYPLCIRHPLVPPPIRSRLYIAASRRSTDEADG